MKLLNHLAFLVAFTGGEFASAVEDVVNLSGGDKPGYSCEGANQKKNLGTRFKTPTKCLAAAVKDSACGSSIMWSDSYNYSWGCRCCVPGATYTKHHLWDIYEGPSKPGYSCEGANQKKNLGTGFKTPKECLAAALSDSACGLSIMWSNSYNYAWGCRCCVPGATYTKHNRWDIYEGPSKPGYSCEGANQKKNLGTRFKTPKECLAAALSDSACGLSIMWSNSYNYAWGCRCCVPGATYTKHNLWDIYQA